VRTALHKDLFPDPGGPLKIICGQNSAETCHNKILNVSKTKAPALSTKIKMAGRTNQNNLIHCAVKMSETDYKYFVKARQLQAYNHCSPDSLKGCLNSKRRSTIL
jgi:hypothetical protein